MTVQRLLELTAWALALGASCLVVGALVSALGSFALMRPYVTARTLGVSLRYLVREVFLAALVEPFLPLYYVIGRRMGPRSLRAPAKGFVSPVPIVLVHGYMQNRVSFVVWWRLTHFAGIRRVVKMLHRLERTRICRPIRR